MQVRQITIPKVENVNLEQVQSIVDLRKLDKIESTDVVYFLSRYLQVKQETLENGVMNDVLDLYEKVLESMQAIKSTSEPLPSVTIDGNEYTQRLTVEPMPAIWFMTVQRLLAQEIRIHEVAALCYIEKGKHFYEVDFAKRCEVFRHKMKYSEYHPLEGFFLQKFNEYHKPFLKLQKIKQMTNPTSTKL
jgi:hypothetical protein